MTYEPTDYLPYDFANRRHIGPSPSEMAQMCDVLGVADLGALIDETVPEAIRQAEPLEFGKPLSERLLMHHMRETAQKNQVLSSLIGMGYHGTVTPPAIQRCSEHGLRRLPSSYRRGHGFEPTTTCSGSLRA